MLNYGYYSIYSLLYIHRNVGGYSCHPVSHMNICYPPLRWRIIDDDRDVNCFPSCCQPEVQLGDAKKQRQRQRERERERERGRERERVRKKVKDLHLIKYNLMSSYCSENTVTKLRIGYKIHKIGQTKGSINLLSDVKG